MHRTPTLLALVCSLLPACRGAQHRDDLAPPASANHGTADAPCSCFEWVHLEDFGTACERTPAACEARRASGFPAGRGMTTPCAPATCPAPHTETHGTAQQ